MNSDRTFAVATDDTLVNLISGARQRLVVIAPALTQAVANALSNRFKDLGDLDVTVILDPDPEVYRLGFGDLSALETIRAASAKNLFDLREQPGVRIGVIVSDEATFVYAPVSRNIEAGSTSADKPNALLISGAAEGIAKAAGQDRGETKQAAEIGAAALEPKKVEAMQQDLKHNPPKPFDITRKLNVFTSRVQYVEFSASNYRLSTRQIPLPPELLDVSNADLKAQITSRIRTPLEGVGKVEVKIKIDGKEEAFKIDDEWLRKERKRIEDEFTFPIANFGRVILYNDRETFDAATQRFLLIVEKYQEALKNVLSKRRSEFEKQIVAEYRERWTRNPPKSFKRWNLPPTSENIEKELQRVANEIFTSAVTFEAPIVKVLYKNVAPENVRDESFLRTLKNSMVTRRVPQAIIDTLFETGEAVPEAGVFI